jgi:hypothetical protein
MLIDTRRCCAFPNAGPHQISAGSRHPSSERMAQYMERRATMIDACRGVKPFSEQVELAAFGPSEKAAVPVEPARMVCESGNDSRRQIDRARGPVFCFAAKRNRLLEIDSCALETQGLAKPQSRKAEQGVIRAANSRSSSDAAAATRSNCSE